MDYAIAVLPGDGIGPEVTAEGVRVLEAIGQRHGHAFRFEEGTVGLSPRRLRLLEEAGPLTPR